MKPADLPVPQAGVAPARVRVLRDARAADADDWLAEEVPIAFSFNGIAHAVMMASPTDLEDFALGFGLTEGLLRGPDELYGVEAIGSADGIELRLEVASACAWRLRERRRTLAGTTGCGLCGAESLSQVRLPSPPLPANRLAAAAVARAMRRLQSRQPMQKLTGATHAAAWCDASGDIRLVREDVGRHNALDKLIGALAREGIDAATGFVAVTSRASFEMVQKTARAGIASLAAVSAPTAMAVRIAAECGMLLVGFAREDGLVGYSNVQRLTVDAGRSP